MSYPLHLSLDAWTTALMVSIIASAVGMALGLIAELLGLIRLGHDRLYRR